uniref:WD_REPEATS_REGION domain-containing protein n=1 Tax=Caenorhabditis tropicalis TaxID=1561998 RepID=A0A1I7TMK9_9PELO
MIEEDFEWNESKLHLLSNILPKWANDHPQNHLRIGKIQLEAAIKWLKNDSDDIELAEEFERLLNISFDPLMDYEEHQRVKEESLTPKKTSLNWISNWKNIAEKLSISYIDTTSNLVEFRQIRILPNVAPVLLIAHTTHDNVIVIYGKQRNPKEEIDLQTVLRHSYSNIPDGSLQTVHFMTKNLLDLYSQLFSRQIAPEFKTKYIRCLPSLWLQYDIFGSILDKIEKTNRLELLEVSLDEATANWVKRKWDNYQYLCYLNKITGRVRGEVNNHPIFPWVCDFTSENSGFRPLNRTKYRLCKGDDQLREMFSREPSHHVPELLSDIGYMVYRARVEPKENLCRHVRRKWVPEEYPSTMSRMYQWSPDECIPEFYDDPSIFKSRHPDMSDLRFPEFVSSPNEFIEWHRKMLENEEVSINLHRWIDLVFGFYLSVEDSKNALNLHLCFVEKHRRGLRTNGMVQLFYRPHPSRIPLNYNPKLDSYHLQMESFGYGMNVGMNVEKEEENETDENSHFQIFQKIKKVRRLRHKIYFSSMISLMEVMAQIVLAPHLAGRFDDPDHIRQCIRLYTYRIPVNYRKLFDFLLNPKQDFPDCDEFAFFVSIRLNIPTTISSFSEEFAKCVSLHLLRKMDVIPPFSSRSQLILLKEVESLKKSICLCNHMELCVVAAFQQLLEDEEASIQSVHRLMPVITRSLSQSALEDLINPMIELIQCETSVKLLDRRFLMHVSICYGTRTFLDLFLPPIVEACASMNCDRSVVAKESIMWLAKRYGPVISAKFISSNLLRIMASCYEGFELSGLEKEPKSVFGTVLQGDETCSRIESLLSEIVLTYSVTFITVQFLPFCVDLIEQFHKRPSIQLEPGLVSVFRIVELSIRSMSDHQLMNYLEEFIIQKVIYRVLTILLDISFQFSSIRVRNIIICKVCQLLYSITQKIGTENTRIYASQPFKLIFSTFSEIYETNEELRINIRKRSEENTLFEVPLWMVEDVVDKFAKEWGVPFLSSFCDDPAFLIPFVSNTSSLSPTASISMAHSPPSSFTAYSLGNMSSGNRLFSLSASSPINSVSSLGGLSLCDSGSLSAVWCARVSAAVCGVDNYRFDHLSLCNFTGHQERIRKLAAISNENSFVSASSDKTVKLWSIKPELDEIGCQWTYQNHTRSVHDVTILADNSIASTDGVLHVWDPFRTTLLAQMEWDSKEGNGGNIMRIENVDRHILSAICSFHSTVKLFDSRVGGWTCELKVSPGPGLTRALTVRDNGNKMAVALSNGTLAILDARNGKINALAQTNSTHTVSVNWLTDSRLLVCDADECGMFLETNPRAHIVRKLQDPVNAAFLTENSLVTLQNGSMLRVYRNGGELQIETKIRPDELPGTPTAILPLPLNCSYLIGSSHGAIRLMC